MKLHIGELIRRKGRSGNPIGPYMKIMQISNNLIYVRPIGMNIECLLSRSNVYVPKMVKLPVRQLKYFELRNGQTKCVIHKVSPRYISCLKNPDLIGFYTQDGEKTMYMVFDEAHEEMIACERHIRVTVGQLIYEEL